MNMRRLDPDTIQDLQDRMETAQERFDPEKVFDPLKIVRQEDLLQADKLGIDKR